MKSDSRTFIGSILIQRVSSLPEWTPADKARMVYSIETGKLYYGNNIEWVEIPSIPSFIDSILWTRQLVDTDTNMQFYVSGDSTGNKIFAVGYLARCYTTIDGGTNWTERQPIGNTYGYWVYSISTSDFTTLISMSQNNIYISRNSGTSWNNLSTLPASSGWILGDITPDGNTIFLAETRLWLSTDSGSSWTEHRPWGTDTTYRWNIASIDNSGTYLVAGAMNQYLYYSTNGGSSWNKCNVKSGATSGWWCGAQSSDGRVVIAGDWNGVWISTDYGANFGTIISPLGSSGAVRCVATNSDGSLIIVGRGYLYTSTDGGTTWIQRDAPGDGITRTWESVWCSDSGEICYACDGFKIYKSSNYGVNWITIGTIPSDKDLGAEDVAMDSAGDVLYSYISTTQKVYKSSDYGVTWSNVSPPSGVLLGYTLLEIACDADGSHVIIADRSGAQKKVYGSSNGGSSWLDITPTGIWSYEYWECVDINFDGSLIYAGAYYSDSTPTGNRLYTSSNFGTSWTEIRPAGDVNLPWYDVKCNYDGTVVSASTRYKFYVSQDSGTTWYDRTPAGMTVPCYIFISMNSTGDRIVITARDGDIYRSSNYGVDWEKITVVSSPGYEWYSIDCSSDGSFLIVSRDIGRCYASFDYGATWGETRPTGLDSDRSWKKSVCNSLGTIIVSIEWPGALFTGVPK